MKRQCRRMTLRATGGGSGRVPGGMAALTVLLLVMAAPGAVVSQSPSSGQAVGGSGSSFGRISGGGGSYGTLTLGVTADDAVPRPRPGRRHVPGGVATIPYVYLLPHGIRGTVRPTEPSRYESRESVEGTSTRDPTPAPSRRAAVRAPDLLRREAARSAGEPGEPSARTDAPGIAPRVHPPTPAREDPMLQPGECAEVRISTAGGIQWRQRVARSEFSADTPAEVAARLQASLARGDPISVSGPDGSFTIRASLVEGLVVGPCREF